MFLNKGKFHKSNNQNNSYENMPLSKVYHFVTKEESHNKISKFSSQQESCEFGYNEFGAEVDIRFYIDPNIYRKLKNAHGIMHTFSVATLVRKMIELFFILVEAKGLDWVINAMR